MSDVEALALLLKAHQETLELQDVEDDVLVGYDAQQWVTVKGYDRIIKLLQAQVQQVIADHKEEAAALNKCIDGLRDGRGVDHWRAENLHREFIHVELGKCMGVGVRPRGNGDPHVSMVLLSEDDGLWREQSGGFSSYWGTELVEVVQRMFDWLLKNANSVDYGWEFQQVGHMNLKGVTKLELESTPRGDTHMEKLLQDTEEAAEELEKYDMDKLRGVRSASIIDDVQTAAERVMDDHDETFKRLADRAVELSPGHEKIAKAMAAPIRERLGLPPLPEEDDDDEDYDGPRQPGTPAKLGTLFKKGGTGGNSRLAPMTEADASFIWTVYGDDPKPLQDDLERLVQALRKARIDVNASYTSAFLFWHYISDQYGAGWLSLPYMDSLLEEHVISQYRNLFNAGEAEEETNG